MAIFFQELPSGGIPVVDRGHKKKLYLGRENF
jgi:hypothetical protein